MITVFAILGVKSLLLLYLWLASAIVASYLSGRKGYGERVGLASGLLLSAVGVVVWLVWPPKPDSRWKKAGVFGSSPLRGEQPQRGTPPTSDPGAPPSADTKERAGA